MYSCTDRLEVTSGQNSEKPKCPVLVWHLERVYCVPKRGTTQEVGVWVFLGRCCRFDYNPTGNASPIGSHCLPPVERLQ